MCRNIIVEIELNNFNPTNTAKLLNRSSQKCTNSLKDCLFLNENLTIICIQIIWVKIQIFVEPQIC